MSESHVTWATSVPILIFLGLSVLELGPIYATDRQTDRQTDRRQTDRRQTKASLNASTLWGGGIIISNNNNYKMPLNMKIFDPRGRPQWKMLDTSLCKAGHRRYLRSWNRSISSSLSTSGLRGTTRLLVSADGSTSLPNAIMFARRFLSFSYTPSATVNRHDIHGKGKGKGKVDHTPLRQRRRVLISISYPWARRWRTTNVCNAWPVWLQTYSYLPNHKTSLPIGWYQIILLGDRSTCVNIFNNLPRVALDSGAAGIRTRDLSK